MFGLPNIFGPATPAAQPAAAQPAAAPAGTPGKLPNGETSTLEKPVGADGQPVTAANTQTSPLDPFKDLWQPDPTPKAGEDAGKNQPPAVFDPAKIKEQVSKLDFSRVIDPALVTKALAGDAASFTKIISTVAQASVMSAMSGAGGLVNKALEGQETKIFERLPSEVRRHASVDSSLTENPQLNHPAVRPLFEAVQSQFQKKYPDATAADIKKMASDYMTQAMTVMNPKKPGEETVDASGKIPNFGEIQGKQDWEGFFGLDLSQQT